MTANQFPSPPIDEFSGDEFGQIATALPYIQVINHQDPSKAGFFISAANAEAVNFTAPEEWEPFKAQFRSGPEVGFRSLMARMAIVRRSPLLMFSRETQEFLGPFQRNRYDGATVFLKTRHLVYLLSQQKQLLHDKPVQFTAKGAFCGSFGGHYNQFRTQMNQAYGQPRGDGRRPVEDHRFFALCIFAVRLKPALKGKQQQSWVCSVDAHGEPTPENWQSYFLGYDAAIKAKLLLDFDAHADFAKVDRDQVLEEQPDPDSVNF